MHIVLALAREVEVQNVHVADIETTGSHVSGHKNSVTAFAESQKDLVALVLVQVTMDGRNINAFTVEGTGDVLAHSLGVGENQHSLFGVDVMNIVSEARELITGVHNMDFLNKKGTCLMSLLAIRQSGFPIRISTGFLRME